MDLVCDICEKPIGEDEEYHNYHETDCPNRPGQLIGHWKTDCGCTGLAHVRCCPACAEWVIYADYQGRWDVWWTGTASHWDISLDKAHHYADMYRALAAMERMREDLHIDGMRVMPLSMAIERSKG